MRKTAKMAVAPLRHGQVVQTENTASAGSYIYSINFHQKGEIAVLHSFPSYTTCPVPRIVSEFLHVELTYSKENF